MRSTLFLLCIGSLAVASADGHYDGYDRGYQYNDGYGSNYRGNPNYNNGYYNQNRNGYQNGGYGGYSDGYYNNSSGYSDGRTIEIEVTPSQGYQNNYPNSGYMQDGNYNYQNPNSMMRDRYDNQNPNYDRNANMNMSMNVSDNDIEKKVKEALSSGFFTKGYDQVRVQVQNGIVNLTGSVSTLDDKRKVEDKVRDIKGVRNVNNMINVVDMSKDRQVSMEDKPSNYAVMDQQLAGEIREYLRSSWLSKGYDQVAVEVNDGNVTLRGSVESWSDKDAIDKKVRSMDGVRALNNQINVLDKDSKHEDKFLQDQYASDNDKEINKRIRTKISEGWLWDSYKNLQLNTNRGIVTLEGSVETPKDERDIIEKIQGVDGVKQVISHLRVLNTK